MRTIDATHGIRITGTEETASLLSKVLWITTAGFVFTALGAWFAPAVLGGVSYMLLMLVTLGLVIAINATRRSPGLSLGLFYLFAGLMGVEVGPLLQHYMHLQGGIGVVFDAALTTALGMAAMALAAQIVRFNYQRVASFALAALIGLIVIGLISAFVHFVSPGVYAWLTLAVFSVLLLVDFMRLRDGGMGLTPVQMSLSIYLDALNIFLALLQIFGSGNDRRRSNWS